MGVRENDDWTNLEEKRVITGPEHAAAKTVGEPTRACHGCAEAIEVGCRLLIEPSGSW